jgi:hypothetical protein
MGTRRSASRKSNTPHSRHYVVRLDQFGCRDLVKRLDLVGRPPGDRIFGVIVGLQDADKIGHAGSIPVFGHNRNLSIGRGLAPLPNPQ